MSVQGLVTLYKGMIEMVRKLSIEKETAFFEYHSRIVFGVLKREGIKRTHPDYDDFVQQGLLKLVEAYESFPEDPEEEAFIYPFGGFAFKKIQWHIKDLRRKEYRLSSNELPWPDLMQENYPDRQSQFENECLIMDLFKEMLVYLTKKEQLYLIDAVIHRLTVTEIAKKYQVSRKTIYQWRKSIIVKLDPFLVQLKAAR
ncbi:RNA polymerase sigma factor, sigma-70 family [Carnobacterium iners]|uniref:RNA polymerase sigma factor, sigma-70 family n=2 Tax=Carnobacterium iners TaxID=1073423 RepID=A0A1X7NB61_9LACT|nr:RNA polymerase sigma factor, sigma-70 family [Carnobacterium iners]SMH34327.1 RNA polymerase sigma factor, sigma-70 family [Carnobacterium iners]